MGMRLLIILVCCLFVLAGCGGGSSSSVTDDSLGVIPPSGPNGPSAAIFQSVSPGTVVTLSGADSSNSDREGLTFFWSFTSIPPGSTASLSDPTILNPVFVADIDGTYVLSISISNETGVSSVDTVSIYVSWMFALESCFECHATAENHILANQQGGARCTICHNNDNVTTTPHVAESHAFPADSLYQKVITGSTVTLPGSKWRSGNAIYSWSFTSTPPGSAASFSNPNIAEPNFIADIDGTYVLNLTVDDGIDITSKDIITITASHENVAPVAIPSYSRDAVVDNLVVLKGGGTDVDGDILTYQWEIVSVPASSSIRLTYNCGQIIENVDFSRPGFIPDIEGIYIFSLVVTDGLAKSASSFITVNVKAPTEINGILTSNTILEKINSPYVITDTLQVPDGITLTIEPGVYLFGQNLTVWGTLDAIGTPDNRIIFDNIYIENKSKAIDCRINISFSDVSIITKSSFSNSNASFLITDSVINSREIYIKIGNSKHDSIIERNTLINTSILIGSNSSQVHIKNNNFIGKSQIYFECSNFPVYVEHNSFLTSESETIRLSNYCDSNGMIISNNFWGTLDTGIIDGMILDSKDDFSIKTTIDYLPILNEADVNTPDPTNYISK